MKPYNRAFTLIELLVVISIITLLASVVIAALNSARQKAQITVAKEQMYEFSKFVSIAQGESSKTLYSITGNNCSECACRTGLSLKGDTGACESAWMNVLTKVQLSSNGLLTGLTNMTRDPWGSPYCVNENQGEIGVAGCGTSDGLLSVGPDGIWGTSDDIVSPVSIPLSATCP